MSAYLYLAGVAYFFAKDDYLGPVFRTVSALLWFAYAPMYASKRFVEWWRART